jgi:hypothetical protein
MLVFPGPFEDYERRTKDHLHRHRELRNSNIPPGLIDGIIGMILVLVVMVFKAVRYPFRLLWRTLFKR